MTLETLELPLSDPLWHAVVRACSTASPFHHPGWAALLADSYGYRALALGVFASTGELVGGVPALEVRRPFAGHRYVCLPFTDACGLLSASDARAAVTQSLVAAATTLRLDALELRDALPATEGVHTFTPAVRHTLELCDDPEAVAHRMSRHHRRNLRRAEQSHLTIRFGASVRDMRIFYRLHVMTRQRLGVPVQPWHFFQSLARLLKQDRLGFVALAYRDETPVAAAVFMTWQRSMIYKYGASNPAFWEHRPNNLLFWQAIRWACEHGFRMLDWGRTDLDNHGLREFKSGWGAREEPLAYSVIADRPRVPSSGRIRPALTTLLRRCYRRRQETQFSLAWPVEGRFVRFLHRVLDGVDNTPTTFWPHAAQYAFALTHDVERSAGQSFVPAVADLDEHYGFRSSFNFVAEGYSVDQSLLDDLRQRGFEIGLHGLRHDGSLFASRAHFDAAVPRLNHYLHEWGAVGFRAPFAHRNPEWLQALDIEYDASCFDVDPYEPMPGGTMSIWPFFCGRFVELPYTLVQDHTLFVILGERTPRVWLDKLRFVAEWGGMALVNVHPDYLREPAHLAVYEAFLSEMAARLSAPGASGWHALPRDVARWWRERGSQAAYAGCVSLDRVVRAG